MIQTKEQLKEEIKGQAERFLIDYLREHWPIMTRNFTSLNIFDGTRLLTEMIAEIVIQDRVRSGQGGRWLLIGSVKDRGQLEFEIAPQVETILKRYFSQHWSYRSAEQGDMAGKKSWKHRVSGITKMMVDNIISDRLFVSDEARDSWSTVPSAGAIKSPIRVRGNEQNSAPDPKAGLWAETNVSRFNQPPAALLYHKCDGLIYTMQMAPQTKHFYPNEIKDCLLGWRVPTEKEIATFEYSGTPGVLCPPPVPSEQEKIAADARRMRLGLAISRYENKRHELAILLGNRLGLSIPNTADLEKKLDHFADTICDLIKAEGKS